jgi:hypothetical protein
MLNCFLPALEDASLFLKEKVGEEDQARHDEKSGRERPGKENREVSS